ncbi:hypothetical protein TNCT_67591 [Trichonephila clavata]|uniref:Uncharacterized protein n=1 Tax=Trichonephila clavata TaxID=2740835 RepID=A0A8X6KAY5_TRICU|nr:hypothetical protein TNCT_67591 [Trichonephila clavata]
MSSDTAERAFTVFVRRLILRTLQSCRIPSEIHRAIWHMKWGDVERDTDEAMETISLILIAAFEQVLECNEEKFFSSETSCTVFMLSCCLKMFAGHSYFFLVLVYVFLSDCIYFWFKRTKCYRILHTVEFCFQALYRRIFRNVLTSEFDYEKLRVFCKFLNNMLFPDSEIADLDAALRKWVENGESIVTVLDKLNERDENTFWTDFECNYFQELLIDNIQYDKTNISSQDFKADDAIKTYKSGDITLQKKVEPGKDSDSKCRAETIKCSDLDYQSKPGTSKSQDLDYQSKPGTSKSQDPDYQSKPGTSKSQDPDYQSKPGTSKSQDLDYQSKPGTSKSQDLDYQSKPGTSKSQDLDYQSKPGTSKSQDLDYQSKPGTSKSQDLDYQSKPGTSKSQDLDYQSKPGTSNSQDLDYQSKPGTSKSSLKEKTDKRKTANEFTTRIKKYKTDDLKMIQKYLDFTCKFCNTKCSQYLMCLSELI